MKDTKVEFDELSKCVIGCSMEVHCHLGPGLLASACEQSLAHEHSRNQIAFRLQLALPVQYKDVRLDCRYREEERGIHQAQLLTDKKWAGVKIGLLMHFNVTQLKDGIRCFGL